MATASLRGPDTRWFRRSGAVGEAAALRLFCFPYAGGSAAYFRDWRLRLPSDVEVMAVQLPGREDRFVEQPFRDVDALAEAVADAMTGELDLPYAFFGISMGARVALAVAHVVRARGLRPPERLFVGSSCAPHRGIPVRGWNESDERLVAYLRELGGTAPEVLDSAELLDVYLPAVRADLTVVATCRSRIGTPLAMPVRAFAGADDRQAPPEYMRDWDRETSGSFALTVIAGGHFFDAAGTTQMINEIVADLGLEARSMTPRESS